MLSEDTRGALQAELEGLQFRNQKDTKRIVALTTLLAFYQHEPVAEKTELPAINFHFEE
jgi:hypothetical protein